MLSQAPIVASGRGMGLLNMASNFSASVLISVILFYKSKIEFGSVLLSLKQKK